MSSLLIVALDPPTTRHRFGINALAFSKFDHADTLYSASRDTTVRGHNITSEALHDATYNDNLHTTAVFQGHQDWVNDLLVIGYSGADRIATASSDKLVKIWDPDGTCVSTLLGHDDYVKALAHTPDYGIASGGLDNALKVWDLSTNTCILECGQYSEVHSSIYAMDGCGAESGEPYIAAGRRNDVVLWDLRSGDEAAVLRSHTDMVRCVKVSGDAKLVLSGAADHSAVLFDMRMQRRPCRRFDHHVDSVWALDVARDWQSFVSGSRDGSVWHVDMENEEARLVAPPVGTGDSVERVLGVYMCPKDPLSVWCCTTGSTMRQWQIQGSGSPRSVSKFHKMFERRETSDEGVPGALSKAEHVTWLMDTARKEDSDGFQQSGVIRGRPAVTQSAVTNDKRHVISRDTDGNCSKYNVMTGALVKRYENQSLEGVLAEEFMEISLPSWFTCELKTGGLALKLSKQSCFNAETFGSDAGLAEEDRNEKVNLGELFLHNVFHLWKEDWVEHVSEEEMDELSGNEEEQVSLMKSISTAYSAAAEIRMFSSESPVPIFERSCGEQMALQKAEVPEWISAGILGGRKQVEGLPVSLPKMCFTLSPKGVPVEPSLPKLSGPKYLRMSKVKEYVAGHHTIGEDADCPDADIEIWCNGRLLGESMSLATCAQFVWQKPGSVQLLYTVEVSEEEEKGAFRVTTTSGA